MSAFRNIFACLVHESRECVIDLVRNLSYLDPSSLILLYNGGKDTRLLDQSFPFERYGVVLHPRPRQLAWGKLHDFALDCMKFALDNYPFDTLTIVDSDQLAARADYSDYLAQFLVDESDIGLLGNSPGPQPPNTQVGPAAAAFREIDLWRPFLRRFRGGEQKFVHWTFWPSTVFTADAARDLIELFAKDRQLKDLMRRTRIWATEEVIFPTLVALLGYRVAANPCSYEYVRYRQPCTVRELETALARPDVYWIHPVPRQYGDILRQHIRTRFNHYAKVPTGAERVEAETSGNSRLLLSWPILTRMNKIKGWLEEDEADLLIATTSHVLSELPKPHAIVEVGSYCGRSTVVLGSVVKAISAEASVYAIDPHQGKVGAMDHGVKAGSPTLGIFKRNIVEAGLTSVVQVIQKQSFDVHWDKPISLLLIDGLHDYTNVAQDFFHFEPWIVPGGYIAFHDYADYYPGVKAFVNELLSTGKYQKVLCVRSMMVVQRLAEWKRPDHIVLQEPLERVPMEVPPAVASKADAGSDTAVIASDEMPMVSCIMPTYNRLLFVSQAIQYFLRQDYRNRELIIVDDGDDSVADLVPDDSRIRYVRLDRKCPVGTKRNLACKEAHGEIIVHWDDDDWMAYWRIGYQVARLLKARADLCGLDRVLFFAPGLGQSWQYAYPSKKTPLLAGGSLCYTKRLWKDSPFPEIDLGEDARFVWNDRPKRTVTLEDNTFYVALIHPGNTNPRNTTDKRWYHYPIDKIQDITGEDWTFYTNLWEDESKDKRKRSAIPEVHMEVSGGEPLVSCIMPTYNRRWFVPRAIKYFLRQNYANKELVIVDDGSGDVADLVPADERIRYIQVKKKATVGYKRNLAVQHSKGEIIAHWDDDDWYAKDRISYQVQALLSGGAKICGLETGFFYDVLENRFWTCTPALHAKMFFADIHGRSIMYLRDLWDKRTRYPDISLAEDAFFLKSALERKVKIIRCENDSKLIYIRHRTNAWRFNCGKFIDPNEWQSIDIPDFVPAQDLLFYQWQGMSSHSENSDLTFLV
jgi:glycosyltransferase involved in cell wall biosynthesis